MIPAMPATIKLRGRDATVTPPWGCLILRTLGDDDIHQQTAGGLWIPPAAEADQRLMQATVAGRGEGVAEALLLPGMRVITKRFGKSPWLDDDETCFVVAEEFVLAVVPE